MNICGKQCPLADGSIMNLKTNISVPVKIEKITFIAELYALKLDHIPLIIECNLLKKLSANLNFKNDFKNDLCDNITYCEDRAMEFSGTIMNNIETECC